MKKIAISLAALHPRLRPALEGRAGTRRRVRGERKRRDPRRLGEVRQGEVVSAVEQSPCPLCGEPRTWDTDHNPHAWRHAHDSRWCLSVDGAEPRYPRDATTRENAHV